ncbi:FN3 associated domain-containing protein [Spirochaeta cellobiosiphila]|uniref:FN3 associated domain-containing protein n=1 Tax=Spirochaeta cellobiosiphila TaxID=504483 RepID=UPI00042119A1|nr:FN3 associated domain-containing protein [Spirochaeta cellobiosiphila]
MKIRSLVTVLLLSSTLLFAQENDDINFSVKEGIYRDNQTLIIETANQDYGNVKYSFDKDGPFYRYVGPINLSAAIGEKRSYNVYAKLESTIISHKYVIDRSLPQAPIPLLTSGTYWGDQELRFAPNPLGLYYTINSNNDDLHYLKNGESLQLKAPSHGEKLYELLVYSSSSGNKSDLIKLRYNIKAVSLSSDLNILSPVQGDYVNAQLLYIDHSNFEWIKYTTDNTDPEKNGLFYNEPIMLDEIGLVRLKVVGMTISNQQLIRKEVLYKVNTAIEEPVSFDSGVYNHKIDLDMSKIKGQIFYSFSDSSDNNYYSFTSPINIPKHNKALYYTPFSFKVKKSDNRFGPVHRYFFIVDDRDYVKPYLDKTWLSNNEVFLNIIGHPGSRIFFNLDNKGYQIYKTPLDITVDGVSHDIQFYAQYSEGRRTEVVKEQIPPLKVIDDQELASFERGDQGRYTLNKLSKLDSLFVRFISNDEDSGYIPFTKNIDFKIPLGYAKNITFQFRAEEADQVLQSSIEAQLNNKPYSTPSISVIGRTINLTGQGKLFLIINDGKSEKTLPYVSPFSLNTPSLKFNEYHIKAYSIDDNDNKSQVSNEHIITIDNRNPSITDIKGVQDGGVYNKEVLSLFLSSTGQNTVIRYNFTDDGTEPDTPSVDSLQYNGQISIRTDLNQRKNYWYKFKAFREDYEPSSIKDIKFEVDRSIPELPQINVPDQSYVTNKDFELEMSSVETGDLIFYSLASTEESLSNPLEKGNIYTNSISLIGVDNEDTHYFLRVAVRDKAGNIQTEQRVYHITIDKTIPLPPDITLSHTEEAVSVAISGASEGKLYYRYTKSENEPFRLYNSPLIISYPTDNIEQLQVESFFVENSGNKSPTSRSSTIVLDGRLPQPVNPPSIIYYGDKVGISFNSNDDQLIYYRVQGDSDYQPVQETLVFSLENIRDRYIEAYSQLPNGRKGSPQTFMISSKQINELPLEGVQDGDISNTGITLRATNPEIGFRYELFLSDMKDVSVSEYSPLMKDKLDIDVNPGESKSFKLLLQPILLKTNKTIGDIKQVSFTIDRLPPSTPIVEGVEDKGIYSQEVRIELKGNGDIHYVLTNTTTGEETEQVYKEPFYVNVDKGVIAEYQLKYYAIDQAKNKSDMRNIDFSIDRAIVYVSVTGQDDNNGTRDYPVRSIDKALAIIRDTGKSAIFLSKGEFVLNKPFQITKDNFYIRGGLDVSNWFDTSESSTLITGPYFKTSRALFEVKGGNLTVQNLDFKLKKKSVEYLYNMSSGSIIFKDYQYVMDSPEYDHFLVATGGRIDIKNSHFVITNSQEMDDVFQLGDVEVIVSDSRFELEKVGQFTLFSLLNKGSLSIASSQITTNHTNTGNIIKGFNTSISIEESRLNQSNAKGVHNGILLSDSQLSINSSLFMNKDMSNSTAIKVSGTTVDLSNNQYVSNEVMNQRWIDLNKSNLTINRSSFNGGKNVDFFNLISSYSSQVYMVNSFVNLDQSSMINLFNFKRDSVKLINNTIYVQNYRKVIGLQSHDVTQLHIINNIYMGNNGSSTAFDIVDTKDLQIKNNNISDWNIIELNNKLLNIDDLNRWDDEAFGGHVDSNINQNFNSTFTNGILSKNSIYHLRSDSDSVNGGITYEGPLLDLDWHQDVRPDGSTHIPDIGAEEF